jgi:hypothetical protein
MEKMMGESCRRLLALAYLATEEGRKLLEEAASLPPDRLTRLTRLRRHATVEVAAAAVELLELRQRGRSKFSRADSMFFTAEGLEQSTGETVARYRASCFPEAGAILDICCGIGGDASQLAERGRVVAVDRDPATAFCAQANTSLPSSPTCYPVDVLCTDGMSLNLARLRQSGIQAVYFDPSRRTDSAAGGRRRIRDASAYMPPLEWLKTLREYFPSLAVKVSPALDDTTLQSFGARVEFISERGECKEAVLWFGDLVKALSESSLNSPGGESYCATLLYGNHSSVTLSAFPCEPPDLTAPQQWLYEPDPAVIRAHLVPQIAAMLNASQLDPQIAYLTAKEYLPTPFAAAYRILAWMPFHLKNIQEKLRVLGRCVYAIKRRGVPFDPEDLRKKLTGAEAGNPPAIVVLTRYKEKPIALLCDPHERTIRG